MANLFTFPVPVVILLVIMAITFRAVSAHYFRAAYGRPMDRYSYTLACKGIHYRRASLGFLFLSMLAIGAMILDGFGIGNGFFMATTPVCVLANRPRLTASELRVERAASRIRRAAHNARIARKRNTRETILDGMEPEVIQTASGTFAVVTSRGTLYMGFADYASADIFRIRLMKRQRKASQLPRKLNPAPIV